MCIFLRKWKRICLIFFIVLFSACGNTEGENADIEKIVNNLYQSDYEYIKTITSISLENKKEKIVLIGKVKNDPYEEYVYVDKSSEPSLIKETYYNGEGLTGKIQIKTNDGNVTEQPNYDRSYPYGYGEQLIFIFDRIENVNGVNCNVYKTEYHQMIGGDIFRLNTPEIDATISQEYYIDMDNHIVVKIYTDLTDFSRASYIVNYIFSNDVSLREAENKAQNIDFKEIEILEINYNDSIEISPLK